MSLLRYLCPGRGISVHRPERHCLHSLHRCVHSLHDDEAVEVAEILEHHGVFGGGVYSFFSSGVGPGDLGSVAVSSIMVDYILTACISAVSAVENATSFFSVSHYSKMAMAIGIVWSIAGLNILGIRENARFTFTIFILAAFIFFNLIASGILSLDSTSSYG